MSEPAARQRLREAREKAAAEREADEATPTKELRPDDQQMIEDFRADIAEILQGRQRGRVYSWVAVWVLLKCHDQWRENCHRVAAQRNAAYSGLDTTGVDEQVLRDLVAENAQLRAELERYRGLDAAAKELLARNIEFGTRADNAEAKREDLEDEVERLREQLGEPEIQWGHQVHADDGWCGDEVPQNDEQDARLAVAHMSKKMPPDLRAVLIQREVRVHEGPWRVVPVCECPHTDQPDGRLVRDGVLALGCPVHDPDAGGGDD